MLWHKRKIPIRLLTLFMMLGCLAGTLFHVTNTAVTDSPSHTIRAHSITNEATTIQIEASVQVTNVKRLGINVGAPNPFGAAQYLNNVITNPGFEAGEYGMVFLIDAGATGTRWQHDSWDTAWNNDPLLIGQPEDFWNGADYEVVYGPAIGHSGTVTDFTHEDDKYTFYLDEDGVTPNTGDVVFLRQETPGFQGDVNPFNRAQPGDTRPGSPGTQSLRLLPPSLSWQPSFAYYMDSFHRDSDNTAGKLMIVEGDWHFEVWAKAENNSDTLEIFFHRENQTMFFTEVIPLTTTWQKIEYDFSVPAGMDPLSYLVSSTYQQLYQSPYPKAARVSADQPILELGLRIDTAGGDVLVDDIALYRTDHTNPTVFTDKYVNYLKALQPGILRNWGNQLGSSLDNQLAVPEARRTSGYSPRQRIAREFHYSLPEFLALAQEVGAEPWYVIPPTWTDEELINLIAYLAAPAGSHPYANTRANLGQAEPWTTVFPNIHLEYGNEMWGSNAGDDPFWGATLRGGLRLGQISHNRMSVMRASSFFPTGQINLIIGGQHGSPPTQADIESTSSQHDSVALAPYFGILETYSDTQAIYQPLFARPSQDTTTGNMAQSKSFLDAAGQNSELVIYELNFHTTTGDAPLSVRNDFVSGLSGGIALPLYMLTYQQDFGIRHQAAFSSLQYSFRMTNGEYVRLWGMLRDIEATGRKRPTWLGLELVNKAIQGDMLSTQHSGANPTWIQSPINGITSPIEVSYIQSFAFHEADNYAIVLFNLDLVSNQQIILQFPTLVDDEATLYTLHSANIDDNNEEEEMVTIEETAVTDLTQNYSLSLPPHSITVLAWRDRPLDESNPIYLPAILSE